MNNNNNKQQNGRDIVCRTHSARSERDLYRVCPSKLNKRELEDLYFALLENNLELKRTINGQREKIKMLSAKVQRLSASQKGSFSRESRECCLTTKAIVNDQKETIAELKKSNERMNERIRLLNMRLCSAKQFMKRSPVQSTTQCVKSSPNAPVNSPKNSTIALKTEGSETNLKTAAISCHDLDVEREIPSMKSVQTETDAEKEKEDLDQACNENKCRTLMEELKQKIVNLQEELSTAHTEYSLRIGRLETEVSSLQARDANNQEMASRLTRAEIKNGELAMEWSIERGKVAELETGVKSAQMSSKVAATIEGHLANMKEARREYGSRLHPFCSPCCPALWEEPPRLQIPQSTPSRRVSVVDIKPDTHDAKQTNEDDSGPANDVKPVVKETKAKHADDSGFTETKSNEIAEDRAMKQINLELMKKIVEMQTELDRLKVTATSDTDQKTPEPSLKKKLKEKFDEAFSLYVKDKGLVIIEPEKEVARESVAENAILIKDTHQATTSGQQVVAEASSTIMPQKSPIVWMNVKSKNAENTTTDTDEGSVRIKPSERPTSPRLSTPPETKSETRVPSKDENRYQISGSIASENIKLRKRSSFSKSHRNKEARRSIDNVNTAIDSSDEPEAKCSSMRKFSYQDEKFNSESRHSQDVDNQSVIINDKTPRKDSVEITRKKMTRQSSKDRGRNMTAIAETPQTDTATPNIHYYEEPVKGGRVSVEAVLEKKDEHLGNQVDYLAAVEGCPQYQTSADPPRTYTIQIEGRDTRSTDTDHEISALTDLPTERDDKSAAATLSPGEEKATSTHTRSFSPPTTDYGTLSEGELPTVGPVRRLSAGERPMTFATSSITPKRSSQQKMEEALHTITEELARCKELLLKQRQQERGRSRSVDAESMADVLCPAPIALKRAPANERFANTFTPKCIFTLHIGTVVLSDEAVVNSYDMSLVLTWKFYDQNLAMTRMRAGRVVLFDFSTEYDVKITDDFLNYMKQEEMPIIICELDKQDQPFASCALPLRDALLHTNRRADMSLALTAGPQLRAARGTTDPLDTGDEVGVIDLWCMLRAEPRLLPAINRAIAKPALVQTKSASAHNIQTLRSGSRIMEQILEDDQSNDRLSQELDLNVGRRQRQNADSVGTSRWEPSRRTSLSSRTSAKDTAEDQAATPAYDYYDVNKYPVVRRRSSQNLERSDSVNTDFGPKNPDEFGEPRRLTAIDSNRDTSFKVQSAIQNMSGVIINEVPANIRSTEEMKQALERNAHMNNLRSSTRIPIGDATPPAQSSVGSLKTKVSWHRQKMRFSTSGSTPKPEKSEIDTESTKRDKDKRRRSSRYSFAKDKRQPDDGLSIRKFIEEESEMEIARRYDNISRIIRSSKTQDNSKKVTIGDKYYDTPTDEPQKESETDEKCHNQCIDITVLWLALNEECEAMMDPKVQRLYVAYSFLGRNGAELETPISLPKPKHYVEKCYFNFKKTFQLHDYDLPLLGHMARCRATSQTMLNNKDCIVFSVVSEPPEDPLGLDNCEDIGQACVYLGDILSCSTGSPEYTEVTPVVTPAGAVCGVLAVKLEGLDVVRRCLALSHSYRDLSTLY